MRRIASLGVVMAACAAFADVYTWNGGASGSLSAASNWTPAPSGAFTADDELVISTPAAITLDAAATVGTVVLNAAGAVSFTSAADAALTVTQIQNAGAGTATFACPVQFSGTYYVEQVGAVKFPGGATATYPDNALRTADSTDQTRTLDGDFTFTADWIVNNVGDKPWIISSGSVVHGQLFTGTQTSHHRILRIEEGGSAYFTCVTNGWNMGDVDIDGYLEVSGEYIVQTSTSGSTAARFGRLGNIGTVKAQRIAKNRNGNAAQYIPNLVVGAGGMGCLTRDYSWRFEVDATITAADDFNFLGVYNSSSPADWGLNLIGARTLTVNVPEGKTVTCGIGIQGTSGRIRKTGAGTLVMMDAFGGSTGYRKNYGKGTFVDEGTMRLAASSQPGTGPVVVADGARLEIAGGVTLSNQVDGDGTLYLENGATLALGMQCCGVGAVELAPGASVNVTVPSGATAPWAFLTGVDAADLSRFSCSGGTLAVVGGALQLAYAPASGVYTWAGASGGDWSAPGNWLVDGAAPASA
ncbi:MAG: hypothetical protein IJ658_12340, partial [Kiritimatiellae bacterium]|nr:hypothetical protein [Kiritimatiellia bacterium]